VLRRDGTGLWALACYFNPLGWQSRRQLFSTFHAALKVPLLVVEWSPSGRFELESTADMQVVHVSGGSLLWQKESLLNLGLKHLSDACSHVVALDADLILEDDDWPEQLVDGLNSFDVLQPFREVCHLPPGRMSADAPTDAGEVVYTSTCTVLGAALLEAADAPALLDRVIRNQRLRFEALLIDAGDPEQRRAHEERNAFQDLGIPTPGLGWACRRETLEAIGPIPDRFIAGGGDLFWLLGLLGRGRELISACVSAGLTYVDHHVYGQFCERVGAPGLSLGCLRQRVFHLHHGSLSKRRYDARHVALQRLGINLDTDLGTDVSGMLQFQGARAAEFESYLHRYLLERQEDERHRDAAASAGGF
jgi:hypothetical protein